MKSDNTDISGGTRDPGAGLPPPSSDPGIPEHLLIMSSHRSLERGKAGSSQWVGGRGRGEDTIRAGEGCCPRQLLPRRSLRLSSLPSPEACLLVSRLRAAGASGGWSGFAGSVEWLYQEPGPGLDPTTLGWATFPWKLCASSRQSSAKSFLRSPTVDTGGFAGPVLGPSAGAATGDTCVTGCGCAAVKAHVGL